MATHAPSPAASLPQGKTPVIDQRQNPKQVYRIITEDEEIIYRSAEQLARASRNQMSAEVWAANFWKMVEHIIAWSNERAASIQNVLVEFCNDKIVFFVLPNKDQFDFDLAFAQADLNVYVNTRGNIGYVETRQVPRWDAAAFISSDARMVWEHPVAVEIPALAE